MSAVVIIRSRRQRARGLLALAAVALLTSGCGKSSTEPPQAALVSTFTGMVGRQVTWTTDQPTRGSVLYGFVSGRYDHLAYPVAAGDVDKDYREAHAVPLLGAAESTTVYLRRADRMSGGQMFTTAEETVFVGAVAATAPLLSFTTVDVWFGDAHVLRLPTAGEVVAIDGGDPNLRVGGETAPQHVMHWIDDHGITRLDVVLATHMHADHVGGLLRDGAGGPGLLQRYAVGLYLDVAAVSENAYNRDNVHTILADAQIPDQVIAPGMTDKTAPAALAWDPLVSVVVLNAGAQPEWINEGNANNDSVVLKVSYGDVDFITGGDCLNAGESRILSHYGSALSGVEYFKASHHGRYNANSLPYVQAIAPRVSVIPIAFKAYSEGVAGGLSATSQTMGRLANVGADMFRYDSAAPLEHAEDDVNFWHTTFVTDGASFELRIEPSVWGL